MLTHDGRRTTHDDGRQPIAIGHLSDSGDLKSYGRDTNLHRQTDRQTDGQTDRRTNRQMDRQSDFYIPTWTSFAGDIKSKREREMQMDTKKLRNTDGQNLLTSNMKDKSIGILSLNLFSSLSFWTCYVSLCLTNQILFVTWPWHLGHLKSEELLFVERLSFA